MDSDTAIAEHRSKSSPHGEARPSISDESESNGVAQRLAAIDIGSNSIRLVVAEVLPGGEYRRLDDERESTRLGQTLDSTQQLDPVAMDASIAALRRFRKIAEGIRVDTMRTIATCAVREAENGVEFCQRAKDEAGLDVDVISAEQEAQFAFRSVRQAVDISEKNVVIADIGGGSTEIVLASNNHIEAIYDTDLGALRLTEAHGAHGRLFGEDYDRMRRDVQQRLKKQIRKLPFSPHLLIGSGGTFTNMGAMLLAAKGQSDQPPWGYRASRAEVRHLLEHVQKVPVKQRRSIAGLNPDRADIIVAGLTVVDRLMRRFDVNTVHVHGGGVRDGLLLSMIDQLRAVGRTSDDLENLRAAAVDSFAESCGVEPMHARQVARLAADLFDQLQQPFDLDGNDRWLLTTAAKLRDVGYLVSYEGHHKHSYQLIVNSQLPGIDRRELEVIANVARYHRGTRPKTKHATFSRMLPDDQQRTRQLASILRIAGGLDRSHTQAVDTLRVAVNGKRTKIGVVSSADPEVDLWGARRRTTLFEKVFDTEVTILPVEAND